VIPESDHRRIGIMVMARAALMAPAGRLPVTLGARLAGLRLLAGSGRLFPYLILGSPAYLDLSAARTFLAIPTATAAG
jgi:hypothetical protein